MAKGDIPNTLSTLQPIPGTLHCFWFQESDRSMWQVNSSSTMDNCEGYL
jgi:hypothetical protein